MVNAVFSFPCNVESREAKDRETQTDSKLTIEKWMQREWMELNELKTSQCIEMTEGETILEGLSNCQECARFAEILCNCVVLQDF